MHRFPIELIGVDGWSIKLVVVTCYLFRTKTDKPWYAAFAFYLIIFFLNKQLVDKRKVKDLGLNPNEEAMLHLKKSFGFLYM